MSISPRYLQIYVLLISLGLLRTAAIGQGKAISPSPDTRSSSSGSISLSMTHVTVADVVTKLGQEYGVNIISDAFTRDQVPLGKVEVDNVPRQTALRNLAGLFGRQMITVNGIVVWRDSHVPALVREDAYTAQHYKNLDWHDKGFVSISRVAQENLNKPQSSPTAHTASLTSSPTASSTPADAEPAKLLSVEAVTDPVQEVAATLSKQIGWNVTIDKALQDRRITAQLHSVTPGAALEALTVLLNSAQTVQIAQTDAQRQEAAKALAAYDDKRSPRQKASDELKKKLLPKLTDQQMAALQTGQSVQFPIGQMSGDLKQEAMQYVGLAAEETDNTANCPTDLLPNASQPGNAELQISSAPGFVIGVHGVANNGDPEDY